MSNEKEEFGKRLAELRKSKKYTQEEFREIIEAPTIQMISGWETGRSFPSAIYLIKIAKELDTSLDTLLLGKQTLHGNAPLKTYKDIAIDIIKLIDTGLFTIDKYDDSQHFYQTELITRDETIDQFKMEYNHIMVASKSLRQELLDQAIKELLDKYDLPIVSPEK